MIGIYGIVAYAVARRTREMGVRLALGTTPVRLRGMLLKQEFLPIGAGALGGVAGAVAAGRFLGSLVAGANAMDFATLLFSVLFILLIASISIWAATRRIAGLNITEVLRVE